MGIPRTGGAAPPLVAALGIDLLQVSVGGLLNSVRDRRQKQEVQHEFVLPCSPLPMTKEEAYGQNKDSELIR